MKKGERTCKLSSHKHSIPKKKPLPDNLQRSQTDPKINRGRPVRYPDPDYYTVRHRSLDYLAQKDTGSRIHGACNFRSDTPYQVTIKRH